MAGNSLPVILYVDDEEINLELFRYTFNRYFNVIIAVSGYEGLRIIENDKDICFIVSDMKMPGMNGLEFIKKVKDLRYNIPCMLLSGYQKSDEAVKALQSGIIIDYMMKPFNKDMLLQLIQNAITA